MWPRRMFSSCGSSSNLERRRKRPTFDILAEEGFKVRILYMVNGWPNWPIRSWVKRALPVSMVAIIINNRSNQLSKINASRENSMLKVLLIEK